MVYIFSILGVLYFWKAYDFYMTLVREGSNCGPKSASIIISLFWPVTLLFGIWLSLALGNED